MGIRQFTTYSTTLWSMREGKSIIISPLASRLQFRESKPKQSMLTTESRRQRGEFGETKARTFYKIEIREGQALGWGGEEGERAQALEICRGFLWNLWLSIIHSRMREKSWRTKREAPENNRLNNSQRRGCPSQPEWRDLVTLLSRVLRRIIL